MRMFLFACADPYKSHQTSRPIRGSGTAELRPSVRDPYLPRSMRTWPCACSPRYRMLLLDDRKRRTKEGNVSHIVAATSESPVAPAATRKGNG